MFLKMYLPSITYIFHSFTPAPFFFFFFGHNPGSSQNRDWIPCYRSDNTGSLTWGLYATIERLKVHLEEGDTYASMHLRVCTCVCLHTIRKWYIWNIFKVALFLLSSGGDKWGGGKIMWALKPKRHIIKSQPWQFLAHDLVPPGLAFLCSQSKWGYLPFMIWGRTESENEGKVPGSQRVIVPPPKQSNWGSSVH